MADDVRIYIQMFGDTIFRTKLRAMSFRALDMSPALREVGVKWVGWIEQTFGTEGRSSGPAWAPLKFKTVKSRGTAHPILFDEGFLFDEMVDPENIRVTDDSLHLALNDYAQKIGGWHQHGTPNMEARPVVRFTEGQRREMIGDLGDYLFGDLARGNG